MRRSLTNAEAAGDESHAEDHHPEGMKRNPVGQQAMIYAFACAISRRSKGSPMKERQLCHFFACRAETGSSSKSIFFISSISSSGSPSFASRTLMYISTDGRRREEALSASRMSRPRFRRQPQTIHEPQQHMCIEQDSHCQASGAIRKSSASGASKSSAIQIFPLSPPKRMAFSQAPAG